MLSEANVAKIRTELGKYNDSIIKSKYKGMCQAFAQMIYLDSGLHAPTYCCANNDRDNNRIYDDHIGNGDFVFSGSNYHNQTCDVCGRECGHVGIYMDGYVYGAQSQYKCPYETWKASFGYGGHTNFGQDYTEPVKTTTQCIQATYNGTDAQLWIIVKSGNYVKIVNKNGECLDVKNGSNEPMKDGRIVQVHKYNGTDAQLWKQIKSSVGGYMFASKLNESFVLDVKGGAVNKRAYIQMHKKQDVSTNQYAQSFLLQSACGKGNYKALVSCKSFMCVDSNPTHKVL